LIFQIVIGKNSSTSRWVDVVELVQAQEVEVTAELGGENLTEQFLKNMAQYKKETEKPGAGMFHSIAFVLLIFIKLI
jgi:hypothetical protein